MQISQAVLLLTDDDLTGLVRELVSAVPVRVQVETGRVVLTGLPVTGLAFTPRVTGPGRVVAGIGATARLVPDAVAVQLISTFAGGRLPTGVTISDRQLAVDLSALAKAPVRGDLRAITCRPGAMELVLGPIHVDLRALRPHKG